MLPATTPIRKASPQILQSFKCYSTRGKSIKSQSYYLQQFQRRRLSSSRNYHPPLLSSNDVTKCTSIVILTLYSSIIPFRFIYPKTVVSNETSYETKSDEQTLCTEVVKRSQKQNFMKWFKKCRQNIRRGLRMWWRLIKISLTMSPLLLLYPFHLLTSSAASTTNSNTQSSSISSSLNSSSSSDNDASAESLSLGDWWFDLLLWCVEMNGAAMIKLMQWASSRPDVFGEQFCHKFQRLQDDTTPHSWKHTQQILKDSYGDDWNETLTIDPNNILGSGCIGQVYKGKVMKENGQIQDVAVKVLHPNIRTPIDADLDLLRLTAYLVQHLPFCQFSQNVKWLNLDGMVEEFAQLLHVQLNLCNEAKHLIRFNENFASDKQVKFPKLIHEFQPTKDVLVETFEQGIPVQEFAKLHCNDDRLLKQMCHLGIQTICRMIFDHNFIHSDLHPGNILVQEASSDNNDDKDKKPKFVLLDVGMVTEFNDNEYEMIVDILAAFVKSDGRRAGELMLSDSNRRTLEGNDTSIENKEAFIKKIEHLTTHDKQMKFFQNIGGYIRYLCDAASTHHVKLNQAFASIALTVKVQEGVALSLNPNAKIWHVANPIILQTETRRRMNKILNNIRTKIYTFVVSDDINVPNSSTTRNDKSTNPTAE